MMVEPTPTLYHRLSTLLHSLNEASLRLSQWIISMAIRLYFRGPQITVIVLSSYHHGRL